MKRWEWYSKMSFGESFCLTARCSEGYRNEQRLCLPFASQKAEPETDAVGAAPGGRAPGKEGGRLGRGKTERGHGGFFIQMALPGACHADLVLLGHKICAWGPTPAGGKQVELSSPASASPGPRPPCTASVPDAANLGGISTQPLPGTSRKP